MGVLVGFLMAQDDGPIRAPNGSSGAARGRVRPASALAVLRIPAVLAYPPIVYGALQVMEPRRVALAGLVMPTLLGGLSSRTRRAAYASAFASPGVAVGSALLVSAAWNVPLGLPLTPALVSFALLLSFAASLAGESVVERLARAQLGELRVEKSRYCRRVTVVWCVFLLANGSIALWLAIWGTASAWTVYTGGIAYLLLGIVVAAEYAYRQWRFHRDLGAPTFFRSRWVLPPRA